ncbi:MAG: hypothetical protein QW733_03495 [Desulfurococcaceae archaeon]
MNGLIEVLSTLLLDLVEREFEEEHVKIAYLGSSQKVFIEDDYVELVRGAEYTVPRWLALQLIENNLARPVEEGVDLPKIATLAFNETRSRSSLKFEKLPGYFYLMIKQEISSLFRKYKSVDSLSKARDLADRIDKLVTNTKELHRTRLSKILTLLSVQQVTPEMLVNLSEEEKHLYTVLKTVLDIFNSRVFEVEKHE